jgi:hypothetical protein
MNVDDKSEMTTSTSSFNERTQRMNSKVNDQFEKADDTDEDQDDFNFSADEELNVSLDKRIEYVLSEETFSTTTEAKSFMKKKNYRYRGLRDGRKNGHKMLFTCSRFDKCPKKCYVLLNNGHDGNRSKQLFTAATDHVHIDKTNENDGFATKTSNLKRVRSIVVDYMKANRFITNISKPK